MPSGGAWTGLRDCGNLMECRKAKHKVLHLGQGDPKHKNRLGSEWIESSPEEKDLGVDGQHGLAMSTCRPREPTVSWAASKACGQQAEGDDSAPLLCSHETPSGVLHPAPEPTT
ncbi:hypothetical protein HGM15179_004578 [Zosterops borbonicus]|uniref:Uncharacterized protein n=1 Tax=Zosterops borbonicus TaxID=364589 RepID=A0A8K1LQN2_9PASS|nr:hypothetical protein HGM15179_004578 [Zosterops borbonicus]